MMEISESEMKEARKICENALEKYICRTDRVMMAAAIYAIKRKKNRNNFPTQMEVGNEFKCSEVSLRNCLHDMLRKDVVDL